MGNFVKPPKTFNAGKPSPEYTCTCCKQVVDYMNVVVLATIGPAYCSSNCARDHTYHDCNCKEPAAD